MKFYVTTPLYYVNDLPHIGHSYTNVAADTLARYKRLTGYDVFFLTGTDEHGQKIEKSANEKGETPQQLADRVVKNFKDLWERLNISNDDFIRTTEERHQKAVESFFLKIHKEGKYKESIYRGKYKGWYCISCETYCPEGQIENQRCSSCGRQLEWLEEEGYFFRMSDYAQDLLEYLEKNPEFIMPENRRQEIINIIKGGLKDLNISRSTFDWGIPVPLIPDENSDRNEVIYVWFEALINYITAAGYVSDEERFKKLWPVDVHLVGKDILKFHAIIWPIMLLAAGLDLPKKVFAHGWWTVDGKKMSKSLGNVFDPNKVIDEVGVDAYRYFLLREMPFGLDGDYSYEGLIHRINSDLANDLGNLVSRTLSMIQRYVEGIVPEPSSDAEELKEIALGLFNQVDKAFDNLQFNVALDHIWKLVRRCNKYVDETAPWTLKEDRLKLNTILYNLAEAIRFITIYISPFMPDSATKIWQQLGIQETISSFGTKGLTQWGLLKPGTKINQVTPIFPRILI
ncbi:MAG: methionine--tRNA ligase [Nitrospirota bacterium]